MFLQLDIGSGKYPAWIWTKERRKNICTIKRNSWTYILWRNYLFLLWRPILPVLQSHNYQDKMWLYWKEIIACWHLILWPLMIYLMMKTLHNRVKLFSETRTGEALMQVTCRQHVLTGDCFKSCTCTLASQERADMCGPPKEKIWICKRLQAVLLITWL